MSNENPSLDDYFARLAQIAYSGPADQKPPDDEKDALAVYREQSTPLIDRLRPLVASVPPEAQYEGVPLEFFRVRLRGRFSRHALAGDVAQALRELGWVRRRGWRDGEAGFRARWYPPLEAAKT